jgi:hypothetical protein
MMSIYDRTDYVMLPHIQAAKALKTVIRTDHWCAWQLGKAQGYAAASRILGLHTAQAKTMRVFMRLCARRAVLEAQGLNTEGDV